MDRLILLTALCLPSLNGQTMESIPSTAVVKKPEEALSLSCRGSGFDFTQYGMHWIRQPAGKALQWMGLIYYDGSKTIYASIVQGCVEITRDDTNSVVHLRLSSLKPGDSALQQKKRSSIRSPSTPTMFSVALLLLLAAGSCVKCEQLTQPASVTVQPGQRLTITCQVSYSVSGYYTAWIRQPAGKGLEWIGMEAPGSPTRFKDSLKSKFSIDLDSSSNTVTLNGQSVQPGDSAVYYCARHTL
ncbi:hypothetical protein NQZ68_039661 [Dissostichus eleginoides]|nr:hypothetical protein NQZ68_039661 [Dissostichus eleginoides]